MRSVILLLKCISPLQQSGCVLLSERLDASVLD
uniref:Uncharacterized protein n=1 Tax=Anguilla anguilla TaxID=7936 RepID=A0A0E9XU10_ANGAN